MATVEQQQGIIESSQAEQARLRSLIARETREQSGAFGFMAGRTSALGGDRVARLNALRRQLAGEVDREAIARSTIAATTLASQNGVKLDETTPQRSASTKPQKTRTPRTAKGPDPLDQEFRNAQELRQLQIEEIRAREQIATSASEKADLARESLALEGEMRRKDIDESQRKGQLTEAEANARRKIIDNLYGAADEIKVQANETAYQAAITREQTERLNRLKSDATRDEIDALQAEAGNTDVRKARVEIERRILELQQDIERKLLDEAIARGEVLDAAQARAALARKQAADRGSFEKDSKGPLGQYLDDIRKVGLNMDDEFEKVAVNGLRTLNDGLTDAIMNSKNLGDVFKNVAKQIIADLIRIAIQQTIVNALQSSFGGGGIFGSLFGGGRAFSGSSSGMGLPSFGRASGGYVAPGQTVRVNEHRGGAEYLRMGSQGGTVIPLGQMNAAAARPTASQNAQPVKIQVMLTEDLHAKIMEGGVAASVEVLRQNLDGITKVAMNRTIQNLQRPKL